MPVSRMGMMSNAVGATSEKVPEVDEKHWINRVRQVRSDEIFSLYSPNQADVEREQFIYYDGIFPHALDASDKYDSSIWSQFPQYQVQIATMPFLKDVLQPYLHSLEIFHCPSDSGTAILDSHFPDTFLSSPSMFNTFGSSYFFRTQIAFESYSDTSFQLPAQTNVLFDGAGHWHGDGPALNVNDDLQTVTELLHGYRYNCLFGDMHVKSLTYDQLQQAWAINL